MNEIEPSALDIRAAAMSEAEKAAVHEVATGPGLSAVPETAIHDGGQPNELAVEMATAEVPHRDRIVRMQAEIDELYGHRQALSDDLYSGKYSGLSMDEKSEVFHMPMTTLMQEITSLRTAQFNAQTAARGAAKAVELLRRQQNQGSGQ